MNIRCPKCQTVFRVDPTKVPEKGVRARCARCSAVFALNRTGVIETRPLAAAHANTPAATPVAAHAAAPATPAPAASIPAAPAPPAAVRPLPPMPTATAAPAPATPAARPSFLKQDPNTRAQRLARALVSDIVAYHRDKRDQTLAAGTLKTDLREEIRKSWEEYVAQVGLDLAKSTPYFREALNEILAKGQRIF
jgi:predicted Zn finger-like uncharacterized protein